MASDFIVRCHYPRPFEGLYVDPPAVPACETCALPLVKTASGEHVCDPKEVAYRRGRNDERRRIVEYLEGIDEAYIAALVRSLR